MLLGLSIFQCVFIRSIIGLRKFRLLQQGALRGWQSIILCVLLDRGFVGVFVEIAEAGVIQWQVIEELDVAHVVN